MVRHIGPTYALQELLYGLIMALATISILAVELGLDPGNRYIIAFAAVGVNITWGLADMLMYLITKNFDRLRHQRMAEAIQADVDGDYPLEAIEDDLSETIVATLDPEDRKRIYLDILESESRAVGRPQRITASNLYGGLSCLLLTVMAALPIAVPVLSIDPLPLAVRSASVVAMFLLFLTGYTWAPHASLPRWRTGLAMMGVGAIITVSTLVLGG